MSPRSLNTCLTACFLEGTVQSHQGWDSCGPIQKCKSKHPVNFKMKEQQNSQAGWKLIRNFLNTDFGAWWPKFYPFLHPCSLLHSSLFRSSSLGFSDVGPLRRRAYWHHTITDPGRVKSRWLNTNFQHFPGNTLRQCKTKTKTTTTIKSNKKNKKTELTSFRRCFVK